MIKFNIHNLAKIAHTHGLSEKELEAVGSRIPEYLERIHARKQGFYNVIDESVGDIHEFAKKVEGKFNDIVVLGIGGSALGTICLQQSLKHPHPRLHVLDNIDPGLISQIEDVIDYEKTLFIVVTKSGETPETLSQYFYFKKRARHFVFITDPKKGFLRKIANANEIETFDIPKNVGGRFSVLTAVGLLPARLIGIDIDKLLQGAQEMREKFLSKNFPENLPFQLAAMQYLLGEKGKIMNVLMPYSQKLIRFADWWRQLLAESIGKEGKGLTPLHALGVTDQHSQLQLYNDGPNDKFFMMIKVKHLGPEIKIPNPCLNEDCVNFLKNVSFGKLMHTELEATVQSLTKNNRPNIIMEIDEVNEQSLGALFMLFEGATAFLGEFYGINAFNQPGVELSKNLTKKLLMSSRA